MSGRLLICTDLDRTLLPNGPQAESPGARRHFATLAARPEVTLIYVSGRHRSLIEAAMAHYRLPSPDFVIGDVGTTIYRVGPTREWRRQADWEREIAQDWAGHGHDELLRMLAGLPALRLQERSKQNRLKLSFYVPLAQDREELTERIRERLTDAGVAASLIWSVDDPAGIGLLDVLPARASKHHAIEALMAEQGFVLEQTVFSGDSGNDLEVLTSEVPAVLVANSRPEVRELARRIAEQSGHGDALYTARGGFRGMNGHYAAGILEGIAHYQPHSVAWMGFSNGEKAAEGV